MLIQKEDAKSILKINMGVKASVVIGMEAGRKSIQVKEVGKKGNNEGEGRKGMWSVWDYS